MNPIAFVRRRPAKTLLLVVTLLSGSALAVSKLQPNVYPLNKPELRRYMVYINTRTDQVKGSFLRQFESFFKKPKEESENEKQTIVLTRPLAKDVTLSQQYVCQIHSRRHIEVRALEDGYLEEIKVQEGQAVKQGDVLFRVIPTLYQANLDAELAEARLAEIEYTNTQNLFTKKVVSQAEVALHKAKLDRANAKAKQAGAELYFTEVRAPFDGIIDRLQEQQGSLVEEGDILTTLSDNKVMWVYFNVPEARYLEYMAGRDQHKEDERIELSLANGNKFSQLGKITAIEAKFNNETGNIPFRADFPNPNGLLRHGQTGDVLIHRMVHNAMVIPQRATFEILDKRYVYVVGEDHVAHQRLIKVQHELEDIFVLASGLDVHDKIVLEGIRQVQDGQKVVDEEFRSPEVALANLKYHAE